MYTRGQSPVKRPDENRSTWQILATMTVALVVHTMGASLAPAQTNEPVFPADLTTNNWPDATTVTNQPLVTVTNETSPIISTNFPVYDHMSYSNQLARWHSRWSSNVIGVAEYMDRFFGDDRIDVEANETRLKLSLGVQFTEEERPKLITRGSLKLQLPRTSKKLKLIFEDLVDDDDPLNEIQPLNESGQGDAIAGLRYAVKKQKWVNIDLDLGVKLSSPVQVYSRLRARRTFVITDKWSLRLTERVSWYSDDGWVSLSEMQWNRQLRGEMLLRFNSQLEWREDRDGVRPAQQISLFKTFSRQRALRFDLGGSWPEYPNIDKRKYYAAVTHRRRLHSNWLFIEIKPGVEFPQEDDYDEQFYFKVQLDLMLGKIKLPRPI